MKDILLTLLTAIVDNADALSVDETDEEGVVTLTIHVAPEDMGKVIGKDGKVIRAIRNVMKIPAMKQQKKVQIALAE
ncbi:MAG TPA: KH domain-containing protein [Patescibacteria group bacterium]|nr:KH domain-containing protein [Patescibacteria group bacterium]